MRGEYVSSAITHIVAHVVFQDTIRVWFCVTQKAYRPMTMFAMIIFLYCTLCTIYMLTLLNQN